MKSWENICTTSKPTGSRALKEQAEGHAVSPRVRQASAGGERWREPLEEKSRGNAQRCGWNIDYFANDLEFQKAEWKELGSVEVSGLRDVQNEMG